ncbi:MAG: class II glutamine amidotransferase [Candidatus Peribacteria bacterium]|nr:MAG: class II glutamine amidotransferase [Candidatus Peribacteria bacterium]
MHGLQRLEYRGYDSAGLVVFDETQGMHKQKSVGKVASLSDKIAKYKAGLPDAHKSSYGIAHTRRATHGGVTEENCHPHTSNNGKVHLVHNGIIENYVKLRKKLEAAGYTFYSETDTEVIANLVQYHWSGDLSQAVHKTVEEIR